MPEVSTACVGSGPTCSSVASGRSLASVAEAWAAAESTARDVLQTRDPHPLSTGPRSHQVAHIRPATDARAPGNAGHRGGTEGFRQFDSKPAAPAEAVAAG